METVSGSHPTQATQFLSFIVAQSGWKSTP